MVDEKFKDLRQKAEAKYKRQKQDKNLTNIDQDELVHESQIHQIELEIQNKELHDLHLQLQKSHDRLHILFEQTLAGYLVLDKKGVICEANSTLSDMLNLENSEIVSRSFISFIHPEDQKIFLSQYKAFYKSPDDKTFELKLTGKNKNPIPVQISAVKIDSVHLNNNKTPGALLLSINDISDLKQVQKDLARQHDFLVNITETSPVGIVYVDADGRITFANQEAEKVLRLSKSKIIGRTYNDPQWQITDFTGNPFPDEKLPFLQVQKSLQPVFDIQHAIKHKDGSFSYLSLNASPLLDKNQKFNGMIAIIKDISKMHLAQQDLKRKSSEVEQLFNISTPLCLINTEFEIIRINDSFCQTFQMKREDIVGKKCHTVMQGELCNSERCMLKSILKGNKTDSYELHEELPDKSFKDFYIKAKPFRDEAGNIIGIVETFSDITTEKQSNEQIETIWNESYDLLCVADYHTATFIKVNPAFSKVLGYEASELLSKPFLEFVHPDDLQSTVDIMEEKLKQGVTVMDFTNRYRCKDGSYRYLQWISRPIKTRGLTYAIARDITNRKKQQEDLQLRNEEIKIMNEELHSQNEELYNLYNMIKESEETYRNLFQNAQVGLFRTRISDGKILESNEQMAKMFGYVNRHELIAEYKTSDNYVDAGTREKMLTMIKEKGYVQNFEARFYRKDKSVFWARYSARIYPDKGWIEGVVEDITERKKSGEALKQEKEWSEHIVNNAPNIIVGLGEKSQIIVFNHYAERLTGYKAEEVIGKEWIKIFIPEELRKTIYQVWNEIIENKFIDHHFENEIITRTGEKRLIKWDNTILSEDGEFRMILSLGEDITEHEQKKKELIESNAKNIAILSASPDLMFINDENGIFLDYYTNDKASLATEPELFLGKSIQEILPQIAEQSRQCYKNAFTTKQLQIFEYDLDLPNGKRYFEARINAMSDQRILTIIRDITKRKLAEAALKESEEKYRSIFENISEGLIYTDMKGKVIEANNALVKIVNFEREQLIGKSAMNLAKQFIELKNLPMVMEKIKQALIGKKIESFILPFQDKIIEIRANINLQNKRIIGIIRDVTVEKNAEQKSLESHAQLLAIFDGIDEPIYVADPKSYEIIFANRVLKSTFGNPDNRKCYEYLQHRNSPCPFCTNEIIFGENAGKSYIWEFSNKISNRWYRCIDKAIMWPDGRLVRNEMAIDITERKKSEEEQRHYIKELETIYEISRSLQHHYLTEELAQELIDIMERTLSYTYGSVLLINETSGRLDPFSLSAQSKGSEFVKTDKEYIISQELVLGKGITGWVAESGQSVRLGDVRSDQRYFPLRKDIRSELCVPLKTGDRIIGVLNMESNKINAYTDSDQRLLETVATQMALAIQQTQLYEQIRQYTVELEQRVAERTAQLEDKVQKLDKSEKAMLYMVEDLNNLTAELQEERRKLLISNQELEAFTYSVSHDLRAPLRAVDGFGKFLLEDYAEKLDDEGKRYINIIRSNVVKMDRLILDLLSLSRISRADINKTPVDMSAVAKSIFYEIASAEEQESFELCINKMSSAVCDITLIKQVWQNLINNAIKYSTKSEIKKIEIGASENEMEITFWIKDHGAGFDEKYVEKLFGVFQRLHKEEDFPGTGVGLAIVKRIIQRHGGKVWAEGKIDSGAKFYFSLPKTKTP